MALCPVCRRNMVGTVCPFCRAGAPQGRLAPVQAPQASAPVPLAPNTLPPGGNLAVGCARTGQVSFTRLDPANALYVLKNTELEFRAQSTVLPATGTIDLSATTWGGTAGATGRGASNRVRFQTTSASSLPANGATVTLTFGGQTVTIRVIVFELTPTAVIADNFAGRSTTDLGVDERVALGFTTTPVGITAAQAGGLIWSFPAGAADRNTLGLFHDPATNAAPLPAVQTGVVNFIAPCRTFAAGTAPVPQKSVTLKLSVAGGLSSGLGVERTYVIRTPTAHMREQTGGARRHTNGQPSSGFKGEIFLTPRNVSFRTLRWREGVGSMVVSGSIPNAWANLAHPVTVFGDATHGTISGGHSVNGCTVNQLDDVFSGSFAYTVPDRASPRNIVGTQTWPIDWEYTYPTLPPAAAGWANDWIKMQKAIHQATLYENGAMTMFKGHVRCASGDCMPEPLRKELNDPTVA